MEAVPRLPMLSFELKTSTENTEFGQKLKQYIRDFYHEDPESYTNEIHELEGLRASAIRVTKDVDGCAILKRYFCQLQFLQSRFPIQEDGVAAVSYYWQDNYSNVVYCTTSVRYEMASILYNIGALHTQLGSADPRTSADGMKMSCTHFQCAAWAFQHLKETLPRPRASDMAPDFMQLFYQISLAQAQECILEKSMMDNRKATIIAKVAAHVVEYYNLALEALTKNSGESGYIADTIGSKLYKNWTRYLNFKAAYHGCVTLLYQGQAAEEQQKMGERLAFYQAAIDKLGEAAKLAKGLDSFEVVADALQFTQDVVEGKRKAAHNDNEFIYHEKVPERDSLPTLKGASLVKGVPFSCDDPDVAGPDIFARLVPLRAHEASSLYSEEKAKLLRRVGTQVDEKDTELAAFMASLQLDSLNLHSGSGDQLPQELVDACAELNERPEAIQELVNAMDKLAETYHDVEGMLQDIDELLKEEETKEQSWRHMVGVARPPSIAATELTREAGKYKEAHAKAGESNQTLHRAMALHVSNLRTLSKPLQELAQQLPSTAGVGAESDEDRAAIAEVQNLVSKVQEMTSQRIMLTTQLRDAVHKDDITTQLVTSAAEGGILDVVFEKEMSKHQPQVSIIEQNLAAQTNILRALTDAYARYAPARKAASSAWRKRQATISTLLSSYSAREDLLAKAGKGLEFYRKLESSVSRLLARVRSVCKVQEEERQQQQQSSRPLGNTDVAHSNTPKLRDYLQNLKHTTPTPNVPHIPNVAGSAAATPYYASPSYNSAQSPANNASTYPVSTTPSESYQWPPSVRPNPLGSEGTDNSVCTNKPVQQNQDLNKPSNSPYIPSQYPYQQYQQDPSKQQYIASQYYAGNQTIVNQTQVVPNQQQPMAYQNNLLPKVNNSYPQTSVYNNQTPTAMSYPQNQGVNTTTNSTNNYPPSTTTNVTPSGAPQYAGYQQPYTATSYQQITMASAYQQPSVSYTAAPMPNSAVNYTNTSASPQHIPGNYPPSTAQSSTYTNLNNRPQQITPQHQQQMLPQQQQQMPPQQQQMPPQQQQMILQQQQQMTPQQQQMTPQQQQMTPQQQQMTPQQQQMTPQQQQMTPQKQQMTPQQQQMPPQNQHQMNPQQGVMPQQPYQPGVTPQQHPSQAPAIPQRPSQQQQPPPTAQPSPYQNYNYPTQTSKPIPIPGQSSYPAYQYPAASSTPAVTQAYSSATTIAGNYSQNVAPTYTTQASQYATPAAGYNSYNPYQQQNVSGYHQPYTPAANTQNSQVWSANAYNTATPNNSASQYTSAGKPATLQTNTNQTGVGGQTYAAQYQTVTTEAATSTPNSAYYSAPYYGYHYPSPTGNTPAPIQQQQQQIQQPQQMQQPQQQGMQPQATTPVMPKSESSSNVDLLAGLDFTVSQPPLQPQPKVEAAPAPLPQQTVPSPVKIVSPPAVSVVETPITTPVPPPSTPPVTNIPAPTVADSPVKYPTSSSPAKTSQSSSKEVCTKEAYAEPEALNQFVQDVERLEKVVEGLTNKTLNGPTPLDLKWKELQELQEKDAHKRSISVARCYPMKNRFPDILPYDHSRVELPSTKDDYINASFIKELTPHSPPDYILTQAPLPSTYVDFWTMVWEQQTELVICLLSDSEMNGQVYWPTSKGEELAMGKLRVSLQTVNTRPNWTERLISLVNAETRTSRIIVHLQFNAWPGSSFPASPSCFLSFVAEGLSQHSQQRSSKRPVVVQCLAGAGRSGLFCLVSAAMAQVRAGHSLPDIIGVAATMSQQRRGALRDRNHLLFAFQAVLYHCQDLLMKRGILTSRSTFDDALAPRTHARHPSEDFLLGPAGLSQLQSGIEKMGLGAANIDWSVPQTAKPVSPPPPASPTPALPPAPSSLSDLASFVPDASSLLPNSSKSKIKNTKEAFEANRGLLTSPSGRRSTSPQEEADPLSQLDPLWSLSK